MQTKPDYFYRQSAVIPFRTGPSGLEVLLITSRKRRRWIVPKGVVEPDLSAADSAANEAFEEAGLHGRVLPAPLGSYEYEKWGGTCRVEVYAMAVERELDDWPEAFRDRAWLTTAEAAERVDEPALKDLIGRLSALVT
jgi:phosphohistidine phosphatase